MQSPLPHPKIKHVCVYFAKPLISVLIETSPILTCSVLNEGPKPRVAKLTSVQLATPVAAEFHNFDLMLVGIAIFHCIFVQFMKFSVFDFEYGFWPWKVICFAFI